MTTTSTRPAVPPLPQGGPAAVSAGPWLPGPSWPPWAVPVSAMPWELVTQGLMFQSTLWMAAATLQARWWSDGVAALGRTSGWPLWHDPSDQLD